MGYNAVTPPSKMIMVPARYTQPFVLTNNLSRITAHAKKRRVRNIYENASMVPQSKIEWQKIGPCNI